MENVLNNLSPAQMFLGMALNIWIFIIFPVLVIRKLNYMTYILESQFYSEEKDTQ